MRVTAESEEALDTIKQALMEVNHAQACGPGWYTRGESGLYQQVRMWLDRGFKAITILEDNMKPNVISNEEADKIMETRTAPRVTQESIEAKIDEIKYYKQMQLTVCIMTMDNGFMAVGSAAPASPDNYNADLGEKFAYQDCIKQLFVHEGYLLCETLHVESVVSGSSPIPD